MPKPIFINPDEIDCQNILYDIHEIRKIIPQRYEMEMLSGILHVDMDKNIIAGFKDISLDDFWVKGHIPSRPLLPGVMMIESAAQLCIFFYKRYFGKDDHRFIGFGGVDNVKFRGVVTPPCRLILMAKSIEIRSRRMIFETQAVLDKRLVFEGTIIGMPV